MSLLDNFFNTKQPAYMQGLLGDSGSADLQNTANTTGLVNMALGYLAAPKHSQLGLGRILAGSYMAGQQGAQGTYDNALNNWKTQNTIDDYNKAKAKETGLQNALNVYGNDNDTKMVGGSPEVSGNMTAPADPNAVAPNFNTAQRTIPAVAGTATPYFNQSKWMQSVLPNLDAKDALGMLTKDNVHTWTDGGDQWYQMDAHGQPTGMTLAKGTSADALLSANTARYKHDNVSGDTILETGTSRLNNRDNNAQANTDNIRTVNGANGRAEAKNNPPIKWGSGLDNTPAPNLSVLPKTKIFPLNGGGSVSATLDRASGRYYVLNKDGSKQMVQE
jgi:hypothetical protein